MSTVFLDYASATPLDERVVEGMRPYWTERFYNPSASYQPAQDVKRDMDTAKAQIGKILGVKSSEIIMTSGGTEANNLAIKGVMEAHPGGKLLVSAIEHDSIKKPAEHYDAELVAVLPSGILDLQDLKSKLTSDTVLVSVMHANNEIGTIQPLRKISQILETERTRRKQSGNSTPLYFHSDACQSANYLDVHAHTLGVDMLTINGGKIYGPKQVGCLFVGSQVRLEPQIRGGGQQRGLRSGTESPANVVGLGKALQIASESRKAETDRLKNIQDYFYKKLQAELPRVTVNGSTKYRLPNNLNLRVDGISNERLQILLEDMGILVAVGSACKASSGQVSSVLTAIGLTQAEAESSIRVTLGRPTTQQDIDKLIKALQKVLA